MSIYALREMLQIAPELSEHIKEASELDGFSTASKENTLVSALKASYLVKVAGKMVHPEELTKVASAVRMYNIEDEVKTLFELVTTGSMEKKASQQDFTKDIHTAESYIEAETTGFCDIEKVASAAVELYDSYPEDITSDIVRRYAGMDVMLKQAALHAIQARARIVPKFEKMAKVIEACDIERLSTSQVRDLCQSVTQMDKEAGLVTKGFNFYKEAFITKEAAASSLLVDVSGKKVPVETLLRLPMGDILGKDVATQMGSDPYEVKAAIEALPQDSQKLLSRYV